MFSAFEILNDISPIEMEYGYSELGIDSDDEIHAIRIALAASSSESYILLEQNGQNLAFDVESSFITYSSNSDFMPNMADGKDCKIYMDRICSSVRRNGYNAASLRSFFNRIEFYCYVICKFGIFKGDRLYKQDSDTQNDRIKLLVSSSIISSADRSVLRDLAALRNIFAHTLINIDQFSFRNSSLEDILIGSDSAGYLQVSTTLNKLIAEYDKYAPEQVDWEEFFSIFGAITSHISAIKKPI